MLSSPSFSLASVESVRGGKIRVIEQGGSLAFDAESPGYLNSETLNTGDTVLVMRDASQAYVISSYNGMMTGGSPTSVTHKVSSVIRSGASSSINNIPSTGNMVIRGTNGVQVQTNLNTQTIEISLGDSIDLTGANLQGVSALEFQSGAGIAYSSDQHAMYIYGQSLSSQTATYDQGWELSPTGEWEFRHRESLKAGPHITNEFFRWYGNTGALWINMTTDSVHFGTPGGLNELHIDHENGLTIHGAAIRVETLDADAIGPSLVEALSGYITAGTAFVLPGDPDVRIGSPWAEGEITDEYPETALRLSQDLEWWVKAGSFGFVEDTQLYRLGAHGFRLGAESGANISLGTDGVVRIAGIGTGITEIDGGNIIANTVTATQIYVENLSAISADMGDLTAGTITLDADGYIRGGATGYQSGTGFWLGYNTADYKLFIGNMASDYLVWDGTNLIISGTIEAGSDIGGTTANSFTINNDYGDVTASLILGRTTGGSATLSWDGTIVSLDKDFSISGNVGIGTDAPSTVTYIKGATNPLLTLERTTAAADSVIRFLNGDGDNFSIGWDNSIDAFAFTNAADLTSGHLMVIDSTGVGIGTTSPGYGLEIQKGSGINLTTAINLVKNVSGSGSATGISFGANNPATPKGAIFFENKGLGSGRGDIHFATENTNDTTVVSLSDARVTIQSGGNVGIGTTGPDVKLHIYDSGNANLLVESSDAVSKICIADNSSTNYYSVAVGAEGNEMTLHSGTGGGEMVRIDAVGNVGIGTDDPLGKLSVSGGSAFTTAWNNRDSLWIDSSAVTEGAGNFGTGLQFSKLGSPSYKKAAIVPFQKTADNDTVGLAFFVSNSLIATDPIYQAMTIDYGGYVGIGTSAPTYKLDVYQGDLGVHGTVANVGFSSNGISLFFSRASANYVQATTAGGYFSFVVNGSTASDANAALTLQADNDVIVPNGKLGIGTTSPNSLLELMGAGGTNTGLRIGNSTEVLRFEFDAAGAGSDFSFVYGGVGDAIVLQADLDVIVPNGKLGIGTTTPSDLVTLNVPVGTTKGITFIEADNANYGGRIGYNEASDYLFLSTIQSGSESAAISIARITRNVGIGTTSPGAKLHVGGGSSTAILTSADDILVSETGTDVGITLLTSGTSYDSMIAFGYLTSTGRGRIVYDSGVNAMSLWTAATERFRIDSSGNVGIGTTPGARLDVDSGATTLVSAFTNDNGSVTFNHSATLNRLLSYNNARSAYRDLLIGAAAADVGLVVEAAGDINMGASGSYIFQLDYSASNIGINTAPDAQFDLDILGNLRAQGWIVGKHAIQLENALLISHFDGPGLANNTTGELNGHMGQIGTMTNQVLLRPGKFGKAMEAGPAATNLHINPSVETNLTYWGGTGYLCTPTRVSSIAYSGDYCVSLSVDSAGAFYYQIGTTSATSLSAATEYTVSVWTYSADANQPGLLLELVDYHGGGYTSYNSGTYVSTVGWHRHVVTLTTNATHTGLEIRVRGHSTSDTPDLYYIDSVQVEATDYETPYLDGSLGTGFSWSGTAHASTSSRSTAYLTYDTPEGLTTSRGTVMMWTKTGSYPDATASRYLLFSRRGATSDYIFIVTYDSIGRFRARVGDTAATTDGQYAANTWHHLALTWDEDKNATLYVDGVLDKTWTFTTFDGMTDEMRLGYSTFGALIDDFVVLDKTASADEIRAIYESDAPVFAESSNFQFRATPTGLVWADSEGLWVKDESGNAVFGAYGASVGSFSWGSNTLDTGDLLLGHDDAVVFWDASAGELSIGDVSTERIVVDGTSIKFKNVSTTVGELSGSVWTLGDTSNEHLLLNTSGLAVKDGSTTYAQFAATTTIGNVAGGEYVEIASTGIKLYGNATERIRLASDGSGWLASSSGIAWDTSGNLTISGDVSVGSGNDIVRLDPDDATYRLWVGHATAASAPFRVQTTGRVTTTNINATGGTVGGFTLTSSTFYSGDMKLDATNQRLYFTSGNYFYGSGSTIYAIGAMQIGTSLVVGGAISGGGGLGAVINNGLSINTGDLDLDTGYKFIIGSAIGWSGTFATGDSRTVTVTGGIITGVA